MSCGAAINVSRLYSRMDCRVSLKIYTLQAQSISEIVSELLYLVNENRISREEKYKTR